MIMLRPLHLFNDYTKNKHIVNKFIYNLNCFSNISSSPQLTKITKSGADSNEALHHVVTISNAFICI